MVANAPQLFLDGSPNADTTCITTGEAVRGGSTAESHLSCAERSSCSPRLGEKKRMKNTGFKISLFKTCELSERQSGNCPRPPGLTIPAKSLQTDSNPREITQLVLESSGVQHSSFGTALTAGTKSGFSMELRHNPSSREEAKPGILCLT